MEANKPGDAAQILLKGSRYFQSDIALCEQLARAESDNHQKSYAYFTEAQCQLLQGRKKEALRQLKLAKTLAGKDHLLQARIAAKIEDLTS